MRTFTLPLDIDLVGSLRPLVASAHDPTIRLRADEMVRASQTPAGPATLCVRRETGRRFTATAYGEGAPWVLDQAPPLLGADDDVATFQPDRHPLVERAHRRHPRLRIVRSGCVWDVLVPTILAQRVTAAEAGRVWTRLVRRHGSPAPGPFDGLLLPPSPATVAGLPRWAWHELGVEQARARTAAVAARRIAALQRTLDLAAPDRPAALQQVPGIGPWTAAKVLRIAAGDADAVEVGDFHLKNEVAFNLAGEARGSDERMLELLAPFAGHRGRVIRLIRAAGRRPPAFGPRKRLIRIEDL